MRITAIHELDDIFHAFGIDEKRKKIISDSVYDAIYQTCYKPGPELKNSQTIELFAEGIPDDVTPAEILVGAYLLGATFSDTRRKMEASKMADFLREQLSKAKEKPDNNPEP